MVKKSQEIVLVAKQEMEMYFQVLTEKIESLEGIIKKQKKPKVKAYYRNKDLEAVFGLSRNTIAKYRKEQILPYSVLGEVYLYPVDKINELLCNNSNY